MTAHKVILKKRWTNQFGKSYPVGSIILCDGELGSLLIREKYGEKYEGIYPPPEKQSFELKNLNNE